MTSADKFVYTKTQNGASDSHSSTLGLHRELLELLGFRAGCICAETFPPYFDLHDALLILPDESLILTDASLVLRDTSLNMHECIWRDDDDHSGCKSIRTHVRCVRADEGAIEFHYSKEVALLNSIDLSLIGLNRHRGSSPLGEAP